ncbi:hypothetical protein [Brevibacillus brevis]|uniref:Uncharacterized protein n=1 Tax=Brevibacillus brevis TaxID=1393 RepID=A0A517IBD6_BREBE|nr:hypothetical protein [Brevibacillus brevis]QDS36181.1 hypothetical protein FPS98_20405 [Brevibacillus brevis]
MLTDFQKSLLVDIFNTTTSIRATQRAIIALERQATFGFAVLLSVLTNPNKEESEKEDILIALTFALSGLVSQIRTLREELEGLQVDLQLETNALARTIVLAETLDVPDVEVPDVEVPNVDVPESNQ